MTNSSLPDYKDPPVVETVLGIQFERLPDFKNAHLGAFWKTLGAEAWPGVQDGVPLRPQFERFTEAARWGREFPPRITQEPASRLQIKNKDGDRMIQVQNDRLHFNWLGRDGCPHPRYEEVRSGFRETLLQFTNFVAKEKLGALRPNQWEVTYVNHIPQGTVWKTPRDWAFFKLLTEVPTIEGLFEGESFSGEWHFVIPKERGRLHIQWKHAKESAPPESELIRLMFTARGPIAANADADPIEASLKNLDVGRETIVTAFKELMTERANQYWGLKHAND